MAGNDHCLDVQHDLGYDRVVHSGQLRMSEGKGNAMSGQDGRTPRRVAVTGANGLIGGLLIDTWRKTGAYRVVGIARQPGTHVDVVADLASLDDLVAAFQDVDAVVHLGASSAVGSEWEAVRDSNLVGTYNVFEAARLAGVGHVVFSSSNHAIGTYETENAPGLYDLDDGRVWDHQAMFRPDSLYGVSKVYGEAMGRYYVDHHGMRVQCLRIGTVIDPALPTHPRNLWDPSRDSDEDALKTRRRIRCTWLSERDCVQLIERCLETELPWVLCYGISDNPRRFWDIEHAKDVLGYVPEDAAPADVLPDRD